MALDAQSNFGKEAKTKTATIIQTGHQMVEGKLSIKGGEEF